MKAAILGGTGVYSIEGINTVEQIVETEFGSVNAMKEAGLHYAAIAYSINWAAGIQKDLEFISNEKMMEVKIIITEIALKVLFSELVSCACKET